MICPTRSRIRSPLLRGFSNDEKKTIPPGSTASRYQGDLWFNATSGRATHGNRPVNPKSTGRWLDHQFPNRHNSKTRAALRCQPGLPSGLTFYGSGGPRGPPGSRRQIASNKNLHKHPFTAFKFPNEPRGRPSRATFSPRYIFGPVIHIGGVDRQTLQECIQLESSGPLKEQNPGSGDFNFINSVWVVQAYN